MKLATIRRVGEHLVLPFALLALRCGSNTSGDRATGGQMTSGASSGAAGQLGSGGTSGQSGAASGGSATTASGSCGELERCCPRFTGLDRDRCDGVVQVGQELGCVALLGLYQTECAAGGTATGGAGGSSAVSGGAGVGGTPSGGAGTIDCGTIVHTGDVVLSAQADLTALAGVTQIKGRLSVSTQFPGVDLEGLASLRCVNILEIDNTHLTSTRGLDGLITASDALFIGMNSALTSVEGFSSLTRTQSLEIDHNPALTEISGFAALPQLSALVVRGNDRLSRITAFGAVTTTYSMLLLDSNPLLVELSGFGNIESAFGVTILNNDKLENLNGLAKLRQDTGPLIINQNASLASLSGLAALDSVRSYADIKDNPSLPNCDIAALLKRVTVGGVVSVMGNEADGCTP